MIDLQVLFTVSGVLGLAVCMLLLLLYSRIYEFDASIKRLQECVDECTRQARKTRREVRRMAAEIDPGMEQAYTSVPVPWNNPKDPDTNSGADMQTIWKYTLLSTARINEFAMPAGASVLSVHEQNGQVCLWAMVQTDFVATQQIRKFIAVGTGHLIEPMTLDFIGSAHLHGGALVFHVFEVMC